jgi:hypothetical protein
MSGENFIGKYVCYQRADGGACWGRIKEEAVVNSIHGEKEVFILTDRYVRYQRTADVKDFRQYYPHMIDGKSGEPVPKPDDVFWEVHKCGGITTLRKEMIDLENDIVDLADVLSVVDDETLFKAILTTEDTAVTGKTALEIGINALLKNKSLTEEAIAVLKCRLGMKL